MVPKKNRKQEGIIMNQNAAFVIDVFLNIRLTKDINLTPFLLLN